MPATTNGSGGDRIDGGLGVDTCEADNADIVRGLENEQKCFSD
jgi:hypothetical protein